MTNYTPLPPLKHPRNMRKIAVIAGIVAVIFVLGLLATSVYFYHQYNLASEKLKNPRQPTKEDQNLLSQVGKLIDLPQNEVPNIATIVDPKKLAGQPFFAHAQKGDKVIIYEKSGKIILYRPQSGKIIEASTLKNQGSVAGESVKISPTQVPTTVPTEGPTFAPVAPSPTAAPVTLTPGQ